MNRYTIFNEAAERVRDQLECYDEGLISRDELPVIILNIINESATKLEILQAMDASEELLEEELTVVDELTEDEVEELSTASLLLNTLKGGV